MSVDGGAWQKPHGTHLRAFFRGLKVAAEGEDMATRGKLRAPKPNLNSVFAQKQLNMEFSKIAHTQGAGLTSPSCIAVRNLEIYTKTHSHTDTIYCYCKRPNVRKTKSPQH